MITRKIINIGGDSAGVTIPPLILEQLGWAVGTKVNILISSDGITLNKSKEVEKVKT